MSDLIQPCPLCGQQCKKHPGVGDRNDSHHWVDCNTCGSYGVTKSVLLTGVLTADIKPLLSAIARRKHERTGEPAEITTENYKDLVSSAPGKNDVLSKVRYLLGHIAHKSQTPGHAISFNANTDYPLCFAANAGECGEVRCQLESPCRPFRPLRRAHGGLFSNSPGRSRATEAQRRYAGCRWFRGFGQIAGVSPGGLQVSGKDFGKEPGPLRQPGRGDSGREKTVCGM